MSEFLDGARATVQGRLTELRGEVDRLERAAAALGENKPRPGSSHRPARRRRGRRRGSGVRADQAVTLVRENPGITIPELADRMGIKPNYLYRVLPALQKDGKIRKHGREWHPTAA